MAGSAALPVTPRESSEVGGAFGAPGQRQMDHLKKFDHQARSIDVQTPSFWRCTNEQCLELWKARDLGCRVNNFTLCPFFERRTCRDYGKSSIFRRPHG